MRKNMCTDSPVVYPSAVYGRHPELKVRLVDTGRIGYAPMLDRQRQLFSDMVSAKHGGRKIEEETIFFVEHDPVITLGRHAKRENLLFSEESLKARGISCFDIERGGDITYHGPGQLVVYPIVDMEAHRIGVKEYVDILEETVIRTIGDFGIDGGRVDGASGVWIGIGTPRERKICAVGVKCSRFVTMHGLALNVNTEMSGFSLINPCGFTDKGVTSMRLELSADDVPFEEVKNRLATHLLSLL